MERLHYKITLIFNLTSLNEMDKFLEKHNLLKRTKIENLNFVSVKEIESIF